MCGVCGFVLVKFEARGIPYNNVYTPFRRSLKDYRKRTYQLTNTLHLFKCNCLFRLVS